MRTRLAGTATSGDDYTAITAGTLTFAAGVTSDTLAVSVTGDDTAESDETVIVTLSNPSNATLSGGGTTLTGTGTIIDDETPSANLDVDGDGRVDLFTDIIMLIRYALSFREGSLTYRALSVGATAYDPSRHYSLHRHVVRAENSRCGWRW